MAQFSIREAVKFSFTTYVKHLGLFLAVGAILGASFWVGKVGPDYVTQQLKVNYVGSLPEHEEKIVLSLPSRKTLASQPVLKNVKDVASCIVWRLRTVSVYHLVLCILTILVGLWKIFLMTGLINLSLSLKNTGRGCLSAFWISRSVFLKMLTAVILLLFYFLCKVIGMFVFISLFIKMYDIFFTWIGSISLFSSGYGRGLLAFIALVTTPLLFAVFLWAVKYTYQGSYFLYNWVNAVKNPLSESRERVKDFYIKNVMLTIFAFAWIMGTWAIVVIFTTLIHNRLPACIPILSAAFSNLYCYMVAFFMMGVIFQHALNALHIMDGVGVVLPCFIFTFFIMRWMLSYLLFGYCVIDNQREGIGNKLSASQKLVKGSFEKIVGALIIFCLIYLCGIALAVGIGYSRGIGTFIQNHIFALHAIAAGFYLPFFSLYLASIYHDLTR